MHEDGKNYFNFLKNNKKKNNFCQNSKFTFSFQKIKNNLRDVKHSQAKDIHIKLKHLFWFYSEIIDVTYLTKTKYEQLLIKALRDLKAVIITSLLLLIKTNFNKSLISQVCSSAL